MSGGRHLQGSSPFVLDARLAASAHALAELELCDVRLQDDARFAWIVLIPRRIGLSEIAELAAADQAQFWRETTVAGTAVRAVGRALGLPPLKLNHGQLGNVVAQLHVHVVGRHPGDACWPGPVWGCGTPQPYGSEALVRALSAAREALN